MDLAPAESIQAPSRTNGARPSSGLGRQNRRPRKKKVDAKSRAIKKLHLADGNSPQRARRKTLRGEKILVDRKRGADKMPLPSGKNTKREEIKLSPSLSENWIAERRVGPQPRRSSDDLTPSEPYGARNQMVGRCGINSDIKRHLKLRIRRTGTSRLLAKTRGAWTSFSNITGEFDPGSERTLAACLTHASRTRMQASVC